jgi:hypothetical protein
MKKFRAKIIKIRIHLRRKDIKEIVTSIFIPQRKA